MSELTHQPLQRGEDSFALHIAESFCDLDRLRSYVICCRKYPPAIIKRAFNEAQSFPQAQIRKSRAAIFSISSNNMPTKSPTILAIDPGTKEIGVAVFFGADLCYYAVKTIKRRRPPQALLAEISRYVIRLIQGYRPQTLVIEKTFLIQKSTALLNVAAAEMKQTARQQGLEVCEYAPVEVRRAICQSEKATKRETALRIVKRFPELAHYQSQPTRWGELYWANMFDAVAVGWVHLSEMHGDKEFAFASKL